jgi:hypothetical protein
VGHYSISFFRAAHQVQMKKKKSEPVATKLDPSHPNHDAILLKQARLAAHRRRRLENSGALTAEGWKSAAAKPAKKPKRPGKG